jgi:hypothetical protein
MSTPYPGTAAYWEAKYDTVIAAMRVIVTVASGEKQVAIDDTGGMAWIDKFARETLAVANLGKQEPQGELTQCDGPDSYE